MTFTSITKLMSEKARVKVKMKHCHTMDSTCNIFLTILSKEKLLYIQITRTPQDWLQKSGLIQIWCKLKILRFINLHSSSVIEYPLCTQTSCLGRSYWQNSCTVASAPTVCWTYFSLTNFNVIFITSGT